MRHSGILIASALLLAGAAPVESVNAVRFAPWINGTAASEPPMQVQRIDADTMVIRQSVKTNFEAPFLYLLFGRDAVLLLDTGAGGLAVRPTIDRVIADWQARHGGRPLRLIVAHSHAHGDHIAGDAEFADRPDIVIVGHSPADVAAFFGIRAWPDTIGRYDLGGRTLDIIPTPGHEPSHIMVYDRRTHLMLSGDMLYPGRLYVPADQIDTLRASSARLAAFARTHRIRALLGAHIEMTTTPGQDYPMRAPEHPDEHALALSPDAIGQLQAAIAAEPAVPVIERRADFILYPLPPRPRPAG
jgi:glyoxylase-like metal-dependent hydrolase (beta-lactamase superfamily II)